MKRKHDLILSASAINSFKFCPISFFNKYILGVRKKEESESRRIGNAWHEGLDILATSVGTPCKFCAKESTEDPDCYLCGGTGFVNDPYESLARMLDHRYSPKSPLGAEKRRVERETLLHALLAYQCHYEDSQDYEIVFKEIPFRIPLIDPRTRRPMPGVFIDGMLDKLIRLPDGTLAVMEHKSTSSDLSPKSDYWGSLRLDTQISLYVYAIQRLQTDGMLTNFKIMPDDEPIGDVLYDVYRKPQIKPKKLSAVDTHEFITHKEYYGAKFDVGFTEEGSLIIDGEEITFERNKPTKKEPEGAIVISETPEMFGARVFDAITSDTDRYFCRKPLHRTPEEIERFERELFSIYQTIEFMTDNDTWYPHEKSCEATYKCDFLELCYAGRKLNPKHPPVGYECIFNKEKK